MLAQVIVGVRIVISKKIKQLLDRENINDILITGGGIIPEEDMKELHKLGIGKLFGPGTPVIDTITYITSWVEKTRNKNK